MMFSLTFDDESGGPLYIRIYCSELVHVHHCMMLKAWYGKNMTWVGKLLNKTVRLPWKIP